MAKVLIVEDDIDLCETYIDVLESVGHDVQAINSSVHAIDLLVKNRAKPDVIILDMNLSGHSGLTVLGLIRRLPRLANTKIIIASGYPDLAKQALDWGADLFISKPVSMDDLTTSVRTFSNVVL